MAFKLDAKIPAGALAEKWSNHKAAIKVVSPANKRKLDIIIDGTGLGGASAAASLGELGYNVKIFCIQDSPRRAHSIAAQGGDARVLDDVSLLPQAAVQYELKAPQAGYIHHMDAQKIGESSAILGAGRKTKDDTIDFAAGIVLKEKTGAKVEQGQTLAVLHTNRPETLADAERVFLEAIRWGTDAPEAQPLIYGIVK